MSQFICSEYPSSATDVKYLPRSEENESGGLRVEVSESDTTGNQLFLTQMKYNILTLESYRNLEPNWDGYNAPPIDSRIIDNSISLVASLSLQPEIFPTGRNSIQLEYEREDGDYVELEVFIENIHIHIEQNGISSDQDYGLEQTREINDTINLVFGDPA